MTERILLVEDDPAILEAFDALLEGAGYDVIQAVSGREAEGILRRSPLDVVITDLKLPRIGGLDLLRIAKEADPAMAVLIITGFPSAETAVAAMKGGAADYLSKPFSAKELLAAVESALHNRRVREDYEYLRGTLRQSQALGGIVGRSRAILDLFEDIRQAASVNAGVLILGESGAGKELVAKSIHHISDRRAKPFLAVNCAAIPENLLEAELFGYERGAFTGAVSAQEGLLEAAHGGTLFLDEVCELTLPLQAKLLRALEESTVRRLGGRKATPLDVRFLASTNRDVQDEMRKGRLRGDLFFRLDVLEIRVPPLRDRREDIPLLAAHFLEAYATRFGKHLEGIAPGAMEALMRYAWPGNVRELRNAIERGVAYTKGPFLAPEDLPEAVLKGGEGPGPPGFHEWKGRVLGRLEREYLERTLQEHGGNVTRAARTLGLHRSTLQRLMRRHHLKAP